MPSSPQATVGTAGTIVLVEDYYSLAVAFSSTLRRLAPEYETLVVSSLAEAEALALQRQPVLFVIDFDPPHPAPVSFFNRAKAVHPDARVLIIGAETWRELSAERLRPGGLHFIAKPFELQDFNTLLHALLGAPSGPAILPTRSGGLRDLDLVDLIALFGIAGITGTLDVTAADGSTGEIHFASGQMTQAVVMGKAGAAALEEMLRWRGPRFRETEALDDSPRTIRGGWRGVLLNALRAVRNAPDPPELVPPGAPPGKKIVVIDDTELLLVFVDEILTTLRPAPHIFTASTGLEGLKRTLEVMPDLVLLDYSLPDFLGDEVCRRLLENPASAHIPVLMMSGHVLEMARTAERFPNVIGTIEKPFLSVALVALVEKTLATLPKISPKSETPVASVESSIAVAAKPNGIAKRGRSRAKSSPPPPTEEPTFVPLEEPSTRTASPEAVKGQESSVTAEEEPAKKTPIQEEAPTALEPAGEANVAVPREATRARIPEAKNNSVILGLPLEITSVQLSTSLRVKAIRAKPYASSVSLHILPGSVSPVEATRRDFELSRVDLDARGQIETVWLAPTAASSNAPERGSSLAVADLAAFPDEEAGTMQLTSRTLDPMRIQVLALFELIAVELAAGLQVGHLVLKTRGAKVRVNVSSDTSAGLTFRSAQVLLDHSARIAEVLLDAPE